METENNSPITPLEQTQKRDYGKAYMRVLLCGQLAQARKEVAFTRANHLVGKHGPLSYANIEASETAIQKFEIMPDTLI